MKYKHIIPILALLVSVGPIAGHAADRSSADTPDSGMTQATEHKSSARTLMHDLMADFGAHLGQISEEHAIPRATKTETDTVRVAVIKSRVPNENTFNYLNAEWSNYGDTPISIDLTMANDTWVNDSLIRAMDPDVICIASPVAAGYDYSPNETGLLSQLQAEGTQIVIVGIALGGGSIDNLTLGELIGINVDGHTYQRGTTDAKFAPHGQSELLNGLPSVPFPMPDQLGNETPINDTWTDNHLLPGTERIAMSKDGEAIETLSTTNGGAGIFNSFALEYGGAPSTPEDGYALQLFYNMLTYGFAMPGKPVGGNTNVDGEPFANRPLFLATRDVGCNRKTKTDSDGFYTFENVPEGTYALEIPNIIDNVQPGHDAIIIASGYLEIDNEPRANQRVYGVRIDVFPFEIEGPDITDDTGSWELSLPSTGRWVVYAPGIGVVAKD